MRHSWRKIIALVFCGWVAMGLVLPGCSGRLGPVRVTQNGGSIGYANLEQTKECVAEYGQQMAAGRIDLDATVKVDEDGDLVGVRLDGIPNTAPDFGACVRNVLRELPIAEQPFREGVKMLDFSRKHAGDSQDALVGFINVISGVPIVGSEVVLEADGYTVVLPVTVKVVAKLETLIDADKATLEKIGQMALDSVGYEEIMRQAELAGWVKTVHVAEAQSTAAKKFMGDVPPPTKAIEEAFKLVMTKAAPAALSSARVPLIGDKVALGILAVSLVAVGGIAVHKIFFAPSAGTTTTAPPSPATATTAVPAPTVPAPRKYPNQTCENDEMARLEADMHTLCDGGFAATCGSKVNKNKLAEIPCSAIKLSIQQRQACVAARWLVQDKCFDGKPDDVHKKAIDDHQRGLDHCQALKLKNCAKGHSMANL